MARVELPATLWRLGFHADHLFTPLEWRVPVEADRFDVIECGKDSGRTLCARRVATARHSECHSHFLAQREGAEIMRNTRFVVIGAGFAGAATACFLARNGAENITIVEREKMP